MNLKQERRKPNTYGRRLSPVRDGICPHHTDIENCLKGIKTRLGNTVERWVVIALVAICTGINGYLVMKIEKHNDLISTIAIRQSSVIANQDAIKEKASTVIQRLKEMSDIQLTNSEAIKKLQYDHAATSNKSRRYNIK